MFKNDQNFNLIKDAEFSSYFYVMQFLVPKEYSLFFADALEDFFTSISVSEENKTPHLWEVKCFSEDDFDKQILKKKIETLSIFIAIDFPKVNFKKEKNRNWIAENQAQFTPIEIGCFFIYGSHYNGVFPRSKIPLLIDANMAFGTGDHETTRGCILSLEEIAKTFKPRKILDMGCGTGILSIAAAKIWKTVSILGIDVDPVSVKIANKNAAINKVNSNFCAEIGDGYRTLNAEKTEKYDIIMSNIFARPLCKMSADLKSYLAKGGYVILAGLLNHQAAMVISAHHRQGLHLVKKFSIGDWTIIILRSV